MNFVTGGTGIVGSRLIAELLKRGEKVRALKREHSNIEHVIRLLLSENIEANRLEWVNGDVLDVFSLSEYLDGVNHIFHCAAVVSFNPSDRSNMMKINVEGTANVVNMAIEKGVQTLTYVSSVAAIGRNHKEAVITEEIEWKDGKQNSAYAVSKYLSEREVWRGVAEGLDAVIVNPTIIIGSGNWGMSSTSLITRVWEGLPFYTKGVNGYIDVRDVVKAMLVLKEKNIYKKRFILNAEHLSYKSLLDLIAENLKKKKPYIYINPFLSEFAWIYEKIKSFFTGSKVLVTKETARTANQKYTYSNDKIKKAIGIEFIPIEQSIADTCAEFMRK